MAERGSIQTGDVARDTLTGLEGTVVAITQWLNGCVRVTIQPSIVKEGKAVEPSTFDIEQMEVTKRAKRPTLAKAGGPHPEPSRNSI